jgi:acetyltransferase-like isoleucine patch superfamily enzyme
VAAGAVVSTAVAPGIVVAGNPARFVRSLSAPAPGPETREQESRYGTVVT